MQVRDSNVWVISVMNAALLVRQSAANMRLPPCLHKLMLAILNRMIASGLHTHTHTHNWPLSKGSKTAWTAFWLCIKSESEKPKWHWHVDDVIEPAL